MRYYLFGQPRVVERSSGIAKTIAKVGRLQEAILVRTIVTRAIAAPLDLVFRAVSDIARLPETNPDIVKIEFISEIKSGVGCCFRETRLMNGKEAVTELEVTEYVENDSVRMVADSHGTVWDSIFTVKTVGERTELTITMDARAHKLLPKLMNPLLKGLYKKGVEKHMDAVQAFCERGVVVDP